MHVSKPRRPPLPWEQVSAQSTEPPYTDPYVRWCGRGGAVRLPPIPISAQGFGRPSQLAVAVSTALTAPDHIGAALADDPRDRLRREQEHVLHKQHGEHHDGRHRLLADAEAIVVGE